MCVFFACVCCLCSLFSCLLLYSSFVCSLYSSSVCSLYSSCVCSLYSSCVCSFVFVLCGFFVFVMCVFFVFVMCVCFIFVICAYLYSSSSGMMSCITSCHACHLNSSCVYSLYSCVLLYLSMCVLCIRAFFVFVMCELNDDIIHDVVHHQLPCLFGVFVRCLYSSCERAFCIRHVIRVPFVFVIYDVII